MTTAKALIREELRGAEKRSMPLKRLRKRVVRKLVLAGRSESRASALFDAKLQSNECFAVKGDKVRLVKSPAGSKRTNGSTAAAPPTKRPKSSKARAGANGATSAPAPAMMSAAAAAAYCKEQRIALLGNGSDQFRPVGSFADTGFPDDVLACCSSFKAPTPIQAQCWPIMCAGRDIVGVAETGSGKTLAFFLPAIAAAREGRGVRVLVLAPTRELAMQTARVCEEAGTNCGIGVTCIYGGVPKGPQRQALADGARVVIATPGRLLDLHEEGAIGLGHVAHLVLDEADRMLDMGFEKDVRRIIGLTPPSRRTAMFTATWPELVRALAEEFLTDPIRVNIGSDELAANRRVTQIVEVIDPNAKDARLLQLLDKYKPGPTTRVLVFALYKKEAARVEQTLQRRGFNCIAIHGDQSQPQRTAGLESFKDGSKPLLIATDVAARGLDIPGVEVVINFTFPLTIEDYVHRIGRTGRAGTYGTSHTLFTSFDKAHAGALQNILREAKQEVPEPLLKFGSTVKKKEHKMYGSFGPDAGAPMKQATRIVFD